MFQAIILTILACAGLGLLRTNPHRRNRRNSDPGNPPQPLTAIVTPTVATTTLTLTSNVPVVWKGIPDSLTVEDLTLSNFVVISPTVAHITLSASGATKNFSLGANDPAIRTYTGGYAAAVAGTFP